MPTGRHNLIQYGPYYFTKDGLSSGTPCKTETSGLKQIKRGVTGQNIIALDGTAWTQVYGVNGMPFSWTVYRVLGSVLTQMYDAERSALYAGTNLTLNITGGGYGDFYLTARPSPEPNDGPDEFYLTTTYDVKFSVILQSQTFLMSATSASLTLTGSSVTLTQA